MAGVVDQRERCLPIRIFFWRMVLSASQSGARGGLFQLAAFFVAAMVKLFPLHHAISLSKMALSKKLKATPWRFFQAVYQALLTQYEQLLPVSTRHLLDHFQAAYAIDGSIARVHSALEKFFASVHQGQAALKLNTKFSLRNLAPKKVEVSAGKRHDSRYTGVTEEAGVLYLFDLGDWAFCLFERICAVGSFFVSRLKPGCDPLIVAVAQPAWAHLIGKRLSEVVLLLTGQSELDVTVLILCLLTQIVIALAAIQSGQPLEAFSFKRSCELVKAFLLTHLPQLLRQTSAALVTFLHRLVQAVVLMGRRDQCRSPA